MLFFDSVLIAESWAGRARGHAKARWTGHRRETHLGDCFCSFEQNIF